VLRIREVYPDYWLLSIKDPTTINEEGEKNVVLLFW
jgi:hypothetical protein